MEVQMIFRRCTEIAVQPHITTKPDGFSTIDDILLYHVRGDIRIANEMLAALKAHFIGKDASELDHPESTI
jgi:hypothetical protein